MLQLRQVDLRRGTHLLLEAADLSVYPGQKVGLVGANGCGKSSLFALIQGELHTRLLHGLEFLGELALSATLRPVQGVLPAGASHALVPPRQNASEDCLVKGLGVQPYHQLEICTHLKGNAPLGTHVPEAITSFDTPTPYPDHSQVCGQYQAKRALEIATAGGHSVLFLGPPGTGDAMHASRLPGLLPNLYVDDALQASAIRSVSGREALAPRRGLAPAAFSLAPPHTPGLALVGGGGNPHPGPPRRALSWRTAGVRPPGAGGAAGAPGYGLQYSITF